MFSLVLASALLALIAYLIGSIPFGLLLTQAFDGQDVRRLGSGNIGATNVLRTGNRTLAAATLALDAGKAALPILTLNRLALAGLPTEPWWPGLMAFCVCVGHCFPLWLKFRGGKAVSCFMGVWAALGLAHGLAVALAWLVVAAIWRRSSLAALSASFAAPLLVRADPVMMAFMVAVSALIWVRHIGNFRRLLAGTEPLIGTR